MKEIRVLLTKYSDWISKMVYRLCGKGYTHASISVEKALFLFPVCSRAFGTVRRIGDDSAFVFVFAKSFYWTNGETERVSNDSGRCVDGETEETIVLKHLSFVKKKRRFHYEQNSKENDYWNFSSRGGHHWGYNLSQEQYVLLNLTILKQNSNKRQTISC